VVFVVGGCVFVRMRLRLVWVRLGRFVGENLDEHACGLISDARVAGTVVLRNYV
jgi:hypothetical protein